LLLHRVQRPRLFSLSAAGASFFPLFPPGWEGRVALSHPTAQRGESKVFDRGPTNRLSAVRREHNICTRSVLGSS